MRYVILCFALLGIPQLSATAAETFSCKDSDGVLHIADNLMNLPTECRDQAETSEPNDSGRVNYVPPAVQTRQSNNDFERAVAEEQQKINQRNLEVENLIQQAKNLASSYENAVITRKTAMRSKEYGSRETIIDAAQQMQSAREGKEILLEEITSARLTSTQREQIETLLDRIQD